MSIGLATAKAAAESGAKVTLVGRSQDALEQAVTQVGQEAQASLLASKIHVLFPHH